MESSNKTQADEEEIRKLESIFQVSLIVITKNNLPAIELRSSTTDISLIQALVKAAYHNQPIQILPRFSNLPKSLGSLIEKGIMYKDGNDYFFTY